MFKTGRKNLYFSKAEVVCFAEAYILFAILKCIVFYATNSYLTTSSAALKPGFGHAERRL